MKSKGGKDMKDELNKIRSKFEKMMGDAWEKYDSSEFEGDLEEYGEDYEKAYKYLFAAIEAYISKHYIKKADVLEIIDVDNLLDLFYTEGGYKGTPCKVCEGATYSHSCDSAAYAIARHVKEKLNLGDK